MARIDYDSVAPAFDAARALPDEALARWRDAARPFLPAGAARMLDLGCGTGRFAVEFASALGIEVVGVEPSEGMLREAATGAAHGMVAYVRGKAEAIPLRDGSCDAAWLSTVIHHFDDLPGAAREVRRVLRPGAPVFVRSYFPGRGGIFHFRYFPSARAEADSFPTIEETEAAFGAAGFGRVALETVEQVSAPSLRAAVERLRLRADTTLLRIPDEEFEAGIRALERDAAAAAGPHTAVTRLDMLVLR
jgi:ubiquinone/menaquinone biosynthesis C-methylase UbiE